MLEEVIVPASVRVIGKNAFWGRKKLVKINIPQGVERIESGTFKECESLRELYIPASVTEIALDAFPEYEEYGTAPVPAFARIEVDENNLTYKSIDGIFVFEGRQNPSQGSCELHGMRDMRAAGNHRSPRFCGKCDHSTGGAGGQRKVYFRRSVL